MWRPLEAFADRRVPKLYRLRAAARAGLPVPPTVWLPGNDALAQGGDLGVSPSGAGWVVRSAAPDEDGATSSRAGRYLSVHVAASADRAARSEAVAAVVRSLAGAGEGAAVFVQPRVVAEHAGVAFFDGFWLETSEARELNTALTGGSARGEVVRRHGRPGDPLCDLLVRARRVCGAPVVDVEYAKSGDRLTLLQVRPAHFAVRRNPILSMANHREILGEVPSPWITSVLERASRPVVGWFAAADPVVATWEEPYAVVVHGRPWMNFSFFYRLMDHWGLPRGWVTTGVGGAGGATDGERADERTERSAAERGHRILSRIAVAQLVRLQLLGVRRILGISRLLAAARARIEGAATLHALWLANVHAIELAITTNFAFGALLTGWARVRRPLGFRSGEPLVTAVMMHEFDRLRALPERERDEALGRWLARHGHRGPLESDPARPRFAELRDRLAAELAAGSPTTKATAPERSALLRGRDWAFYPDRRRERFRDELMHLWRELRARALAFAASEVAAGWLDAAEDVFLLGGDELISPRREWRERVERARAERERHLALVLPVTADLDALRTHAAVPASPNELRGIGIGTGIVRGAIRRARELDEVLGSAGHGDEVLLVPSLEPSWAVVFPRFVAVVSELGGELSHAAILLRESGHRAVVDCRGAFAALADGDVVEVEAGRGTVTRIQSPGKSFAPS